MAEIFKVPLVLTAQPEGGYAVTSPVLRRANWGLTGRNSRTLDEISALL